MSTDFAINVDFAVMREDGSKRKTLLAWGDPVRMTKQTSSRIEIEVDDWTAQRDGTIKPIVRKGFLKRKAGGREVALPADQVEVLKIVFVDVQRRRPVIWTPRGRVITIDGGDNQMFARFLAARFARLHDADAPEDRRDDRHARRRRPLLGAHGDPAERDRDGARRAQAPVRAPAAPLPQRPGQSFDRSVPELASFGASRQRRGRRDRDRPGVGPAGCAADADEHAVQGVAQALEAWSSPAPIEFRRLAKGDTDAFAFLGDEGIVVDVLGPLFRRRWRHGGPAVPEGAEGRRAADASDFKAGSLSRIAHQWSLDRAAAPLRNVRILFAGGLNNASETKLAAEHAAGTIDLGRRSSRSRTTLARVHARFLGAVSPLVSVVSPPATRTHARIHPPARDADELARPPLARRRGSRLRHGAGRVLRGRRALAVQATASAKPTTSSIPPVGVGCVRVRTDGRHCGLHRQRTARLPRGLRVRRRRAGARSPRSSGHGELVAGHRPV